MDITRQSLLTNPQCVTRTQIWYPRKKTFNPGKITNSVTITGGEGGDDDGPYKRFWRLTLLMKSHCIDYRNHDGLVSLVGNGFENPEVLLTEEEREIMASWKLSSANGMHVISTTLLSFIFEKEDTLTSDTHKENTKTLTPALTWQARTKLLTQALPKKKPNEDNSVTRMVERISRRRETAQHTHGPLIETL